MNSHALEPLVICDASPLILLAKLILFATLRQHGWYIAPRLLEETLRAADET